MTEEERRCNHCGVTYTYIKSGHGCLSERNDSRLCPTCKQAVNEALAKIPVRFEYRYRDIREMPEEFAEVTIEKLLESEAELFRLRSDRIMGQRIWPGLYNLETGDSQNIREIRYKDVKFRVTTWGKSDEYIIEVRREYDILRGTWVLDDDILKGTWI